jgi:hypothetical protein
MNYILLRDALSEIDRVDHNGNPVPFSLRFVTADRKRDTGGEIIAVKNAVKCVGKKNGEVVFLGKEITAPRRNAHHWENSTRNIALENGGIRKIHIRLIIEFNGQKVIY